MFARPQPLYWLTLDPVRGASHAWLALALALAAAIAGLDYITGYDFSLLIAYLVPIFLATWMIGRAAGVALACIAVGLWTAMFAFKHPFSHPFLFMWEAALQFCVYIIFVVVLNHLRIALAHADERFVTVLEGLHASVYVVDAGGGELLYLNQKGREAFGGGGTSSVREIERRLGIRFADLMVAQQSGAGMPLEMRDSATGKWYWLAVRVMRWVDGRIVQLHIATDITARKQAEEVSRQQHEKLDMTARLVTVGEMASVLAHELNQPLAAIANYNMGCVRRLRSGNWRPGELLDALEKSSAQAGRAGSIIQRVREFLRKRELDLAPSDLSGMIMDVAGLIRAEAGRHAIDLRLDLDPRLPKALADGIMIKQVLINLVRNAIEAMQAVPAEQRELRIHSSAESPDRLHVEVADRGPGLPSELTENLFRPFFTTKADGMGMGLQICRSIIEFHGGRMWATANPGGGVVIHFTLVVAKP